MCMCMHGSPRTVEGTGADVYSATVGQGHRCANAEVYHIERLWGHAHHAVLAQGGLELRELLSEALEVGPTRLARHDQLVLPD